MGLFRTFLCVAFCGYLASGCAVVSEKHYFASVTQPTAANPTGIVNIFRLRVHANTGMANVRYIAGTYDERAVDFFLNEVKAKDYTNKDSTGHVDPVFRLNCPIKDDPATDKDECLESYQEAIRLVPLSGDADDLDGSAFVIILSTNANAISETIGAIAENDIAIRSVNYLLNRDTFEAAKTLETLKVYHEAERKAVLDTLSGQFEGYGDHDAQGTERELTILKTIAVALAPDEAITFNDIGEAKAWFSTVK